MQKFTKKPKSLAHLSLPKEWEDLVDTTFDKVQSSLMKTLEEHRQLAKEYITLSYNDPCTSKKAWENLRCLEKSETLNNLIQDINSSFDGFVKAFEITSSYQSDEIKDFHKQNLREIAEIPVPYIMATKCIESIEKKNLLALGDAMGYLYLWDAYTYRSIQSIRAFTTWVTAIKYCQANDYLFAGSAEAKFKVYKFTKHGKVALMKVVQAYGTVFSLLPLEHRGVFLMSGVDMGITVWNLNSISLRGQLYTKGNYGVGHNLCYIPKYDLVAVGFSTGVITLYDVENGQEFVSTSTGKQNWYIYHVIFVEETNHLLAYIGQGKIGCFKFSYHERTLNLSRTINFIDYNLRSLVSANNGRLILINAGSRAIYGYDWNSEILFEVYKTNDGISGFKSLPGKRLLISEHPSKCVILSYE